MTPIFLAKAPFSSKTQTTVRIGVEAMFSVQASQSNRCDQAATEAMGKIMVAIEMPRDFVSHPVMKQVSRIAIISLCVDFNNQFVKLLENFEYFLLLPYQLCSNYLLRLSCHMFWPYLSLPIAMPSYWIFFCSDDPRPHFVHSLEGTDDWV